MITTLAISGYRSLRDIVVPLESLTVVTGANGSGKTSLYRSLRLLAETAQNRLIRTLAAEGGLQSTLWAGPETISRQMRSGVHPIQGTVRKDRIALKLGFCDENFGYAIDLGLPSAEHPFPLDPAIKLEAMWTGDLFTKASLFAERRASMVRLRKLRTHEWRHVMQDLSPFDSMVTHCADPDDGAELLSLRERMRDWRFYDALRTDPDAPARRPQIMSYTPVLSGDGGDLAAAIATIRAIGDRETLDEVIEHAFPGSTLETGSGDHAGILFGQKGLLRPLGAGELSDGTLRYLLLVAALLSPRPPELMVLNEPEASLHPSLMPALARLVVLASTKCQIVLVSHSKALIDAIRAAGDVSEIRLEKSFGETGAPDADAPRWAWPKR